MKTIIIVGGGPAGMMAAIAAKKATPQHHIILFERNNELGKKLKITGGGRCNVTADVTNEALIQAIPKNGKFLYSSFSRFNAQDIQAFFEMHHCPLKIEDHDRVFPQSNQAKSIIETLEVQLRALDVEIIFNALIQDIDIKRKTLTVLTTQVSTIAFDFLILATGGKTYKQTGSDGSMYPIIEKMGHRITPLLPAEVPLVSNDPVISNKILQGLTFPDIKLTIFNEKQKKKQTIVHDLLFTHFGISGPAALRASYYVQQVLAKATNCTIQIDFLPNINTATLLQLLQQNNDPLLQCLQKLKLPKRFIHYLLDTTNNNVQQLTSYLKAFPLSIYQTRGFQQAFVTNGGVVVQEIIPQTMRSKYYPYLAFAGELIDISGYTGGYNITAALSTGYTAGTYITE